MSDTPIGRAKGGHARASKLTPEQRSEIARRAGRARHGVDDDFVGPVFNATHGSADKPLNLSGLEIPCYVLEDERRVIILKGLMSALGMSRGGRGYAKGQGDRLGRFLTGKTLSAHVSKDLLKGISQPIQFRIRREDGKFGGMAAVGYEATILADICEAVLAARRAGDLHPRQAHIADQCEILVRGFARVGIIALVDEATGFQHDRAKDALERILQAFIAKELQPWLQTFPNDFYVEMFRLRGLKFPTGTVKRPQYFGVLTNDIVYKRLAPGVLDELKKVVPKTETGRPKARLFQQLTKNVGYPKLREHLGSVVTMMKLSDRWQDFMVKLDRLHPRFGETIPLPLDLSADDGRGL